MPRSPLTPISSNQRRSKELTPYKRAIVAGAARFGASATEIANGENIAISTVRDTIRKDPQRNEGQSAPRSGRPSKVSEADTRIILRIARQNPSLTYAQLKAQTGLDLSHATFYRVLKAAGITNWIAKQRPMLTPDVARKRLTWARAHVNWTKEQWAQVIWSDECSVERGSGKQRQWVFRTLKQKWHPNMIQEYKKGKDKRVMVWGAFSGASGRSDLYVMDRDFESKKNGYSAKSYLEVLDAMIPTLWEPSMTFMQDNAPIHGAKKVAAWFKERGIPVMIWPPYSPDLNPIEHLWWHLKKLVYEVRPDIEEIRGEEAIEQALKEALKEAWILIKQQILDNVLKSMEARCKAVITANGWHTRY